MSLQDSLDSEFGTQLSCSYQKIKLMLVWRNTAEIKLFWQQTNITDNGGTTTLLNHILYSIIDSRRDKLIEEKKTNNWRT